MDFSAAATSSCSKTFSFSFLFLLEYCATYHSDVLEGASLLNVLQGSSQVLELKVDGLLGSLGVLDGLNFESVDSLQLTGDIIGGGLEGLEALFDLVDDGLVLEA